MITWMAVEAIVNLFDDDSTEWAGQKSPSNKRLEQKDERNAVFCL